MVAALVPTSAATVPNGYSTGLTYTFNDTALTATVTGIGTCTDKHVMVPPTVTENGKTYQVTTLGASAFKAVKTFDSMTLPEGLTTISGSAFFQCGIHTINLPQTLKTIGSSTFGGAWLETIVFPASLEQLDGSYILHSMSGLISVKFLGNTQFNACVNLFRNDRNLREVYLPDTLTAFYAGMFGACDRLQTLVVGAKVTSIPYGAFVDHDNTSNPLAKIGNIYYTGTPAQKAAISMPDGDDGTKNPAAAAHWYYYSATYRAQDGSGNEYWHYNQNGDVMLWRDSDLANATVTDNGNYVYSGVAIRPDLTVKVGDKTLTPDVDYTLVATENLNAGTANWQITGKGDYCGTQTGTFTIAKQSVPLINPTVVVPMTEDSATITLGDYYSGERYTFNNDTKTITGACEIPVLLTLRDPNNYVWADGSTNTYNSTLTIETAYTANVISGELSLAGWEYGQKANTPTGLTAKYGSVFYEYQRVGAASWTLWTAQTPVAAGDYLVRGAVAAQDGDYDRVDSTPVSFRITPRVLTVAGATIDAKTDDGTTAGSGQIALDGILPGDSVTANGTFTWAAATVGTTAFMVTDITLDNDNYALATTTYTGESLTGIQAKPATPAAPTEPGNVTNDQLQQIMVVGIIVIVLLSAVTVVGGFIFMKKRHPKAA